VVGASGADGQAEGLDARRAPVAAADQRDAVDAMSFWAYHRVVWSRAWRGTVRFLKAHVLVGLVIAVVTAVVTGRVSADIGEAFNVRVAVYAAVAAAVFVTLCVFWKNLIATPWRLYDEQAARLRAFEHPGRDPAGPAARARGDRPGSQHPKRMDPGFVADNRALRFRLVIEVCERRAAIIADGAA
jgi:hypothetical protein